MSKKLTKRAAARQAEQQRADQANAATLTPELAQSPGFFNEPIVRRLLPTLALLVITLFALYPALHGIYIWDDDQWLTHNGLILDDGHLPLIWFRPTASPHYYPLVFTTYWIEYRLFHGLGVVGSDGLLRGFGYHVDNLILHMISAWFIYAIIKRLKLPGGTLGAWLSAVIFAIHPCSVESVAWVAERKNCLGGAFFFASLYFGLKFFDVFASDRPRPNTGLNADDSQPKPLWGTYALALLMFVASMLSKTTACVAGPVLLLMIWWRRGRISMREICLSIPFFVIGAGMGAFTAYLESQHVGATGPEFAYSFLQRTCIAGTGLWFYIWKLFVPYPVMQIYPRFDIVAGKPITNVIYYIAPAAYLAMLTVLFFLRKKISRGPLTAMLFFAGVLSPALGFLNFYTMVFTFVADHYQYYACIGVIVLAVEGILLGLKKLSQHISAKSDPEAPIRFRRLTTTLVCGGIVLSLALLANGVSQLYSDGEKLWTFNIEHNGKNFGVYGCLAATRMNRQPPDVQGALEALNYEVACNPSDWRGYNGIGMVLLDNNQPEEGMKYLLKAESLMPDFVRNARIELFEKKAAEAVNPVNQTGRSSVTFGPHFLLGRHYEANGEYDRALAEYQIDLTQYPHDLSAMLHIGVCYQGKEDYATAIEWYRKAIKLYPNYAQAWWQLGISLLATKQDGEAYAALSKAKELDPVMVSRELNDARAERLRQSRPK